MDAPHAASRGGLGELFGRVGMGWAAAQGRLPWKAGWLNVTNDLLWLWPFALILYAALGQHRGRPGTSR